MNGESNMFLWISAGLCFIIIVIISIFNFFRISNLETETDNLQISLRNETESNIQTAMDEDNSNLKQELVDLKKEMESNINSNVKYIVENQKVVDSNQNVLIDQNELDIFNIGSNITHVIEPKMLVFDGQFKSLEENIEDNDAEIALLATQSASQDILNDQFSNQNETLQNQLDNIMAKDFGEQIKTLSADIKFNEQSITNLSVSLDDKYQSLSNMDYTLLQSNIDLSTNLLSLSRASAGLATVVNEIV